MFCSSDSSFSVVVVVDAIVLVQTVSELWTMLAGLGDFGGVVELGTQRLHFIERWDDAVLGARNVCLWKESRKWVARGNMWAFGLIVLQLLTGQEWISGTNAIEIGKSVKAFYMKTVCQKAKIPKSVESLLKSTGTTLIFRANPVWSTDEDFGRGNSLAIHPPRTRNYEEDNRPTPSEAQ
ncbi:hypothetical protein BLNAU_25134 [Blattamonas nauphoetae]|uniref:Uncharacterized protein n=1 Tax=Blattamonas nauphoetae TaxID=2049346 RepID=A0ABQ9WKG1_9EUKA|nr:hypothetical protein BLNAU_25134 [Blattamonas nauphoetae]